MLVVSVPMVSAFESNTINVTPFVKQAVITGKSFAAAQASLLPLDDPAYPDKGGPFGHFDVNIPEIVPTHTEVCWDVTISVTNDNPEIMWQAVLRDKFSAEMTDPVTTLPDVPVFVREMNQNKGKGKGKRSSGAIEVTWWVDYDEFNTGPYPETNGIAFVTSTNGKVEIDDDNFKTPAPGSSGLAVGETAQLFMYVCTGDNPSGKQSYTSPGCYNFNSGLTVKWLVGDPDTQMELHQMSFDGNPLAVLATDSGVEDFPGQLDTCRQSVQ